MAIRIFLIAALLLVPLIVSTVQAEGLPPVCYKKRQKCCYEFEPCGKVTKDVKKYYACPGSDYTSCYKEETYEYPKFCSKEEPHCDTHELLEGTEKVLLLLLKICDYPSEVSIFKKCFLF